MKRTTLRRKTPLKHSSFLKGTISQLRRSRISAVSKKKQKDDKEYLRLRAIHLLEHRGCQIEWDDGCTRAATQIHHRKRRGKHYLNTKEFLSSCAHCHSMVEDNGKEAERRGFLIREYKTNTGLKL